MLLAQWTMLWVRFGESIAACAFCCYLSMRLALYSCFAWFSGTTAVLVQGGGGTPVLENWPHSVAMDARGRTGMISVPEGQ